MKKVIVLLMLSLFVASSAMAVVDPAVNAMGVYFDANADVYETTAAVGFCETHIMLTNSEFGAIYGYEFGYVIDGAHMVSGTALIGAGPIDVGGGPGNHIVGLAAPLATGEATILTTLTIFVMDANPIAITLKGALPNSMEGSVLPNIVAPPGDVLVGCPSSAWLDGNPSVCAMINGTGVVATDDASWDGVKSLYR